MSFINLNYGLICFEDQNINAPMIRNLDITRSMMGVSASNERTERVDGLLPGESRVVAATNRTLGAAADTELAIWRPLAEMSATIRVEWTGIGTTPAFRAQRALGLASDSEVSLYRQNPATMRIQSTAMNTAACQVGDKLRIERSTDLMTSVFSLVNVGMYDVLAVGANYVDVLDNGTMTPEVIASLGADFAKQISVVSAAGVQIGDMLDIRAVNPNNCGEYRVTDVSHNYVEFQNPFAVEEAFLYNSNVQVYDRLVSFVYLRATGEVCLKVNDGTEMPVSRFGTNEAFLMGSVQAYKLEVVNRGTTPVSVTVHHASLG